MQVAIKVCIPWQKGGIINDWHEACARAIELFGLPGEKYYCNLSKEAMEFHFKDEKDAIIFELKCG